MTEPKEHFAHTKLTALSAKEVPTRKSLKTLHLQVNANAESVPSTRGGANHGHLGIVLSPEDYATIQTEDGVAKTPWVNPEHPGPRPEIPDEATQYQIAEANRQYKADAEEYRLFKSTEAALRNQLLEAVPEIFISILENKHRGYGGLTPLQILNHLDANYGEVTAADLRVNIQNLHRQWTPDQPIEDLWQQIKDCMDFAADHNPITECTAVQAAVANLEESGAFVDTLKEWELKPLAEQTLANLKSKINLAARVKHKQLTAKGAGYANKATGANKENTPTPNPTPGIPGMSYCWTHGFFHNYGRNIGHNSTTCLSKEEGHRDEATVDNMMGGNNRVQRKNREKQVWKPKTWQPNPRAPRNSTNNNE